MQAHALVHIARIYIKLRVPSIKTAHTLMQPTDSPVNWGKLPHLRVQFATAVIIIVGATLFSPALVNEAAIPKNLFKSVCFELSMSHWIRLLRTKLVFSVNLVLASDFVSGIFALEGYADGYLEKNK